MSTKEDLHKLDQQLYPTGRAFVISEDSEVDKLNTALIESEVRAYDAALSVLDEILPDNDNFTVEMATAWEQRLGLITNSLVSLSDRKAAIRRKYNHPGDIPARQSHDYLEESLQLAGFDVYVHDNTNGMSIESVLQTNSNIVNFGQNNFGSFNFGNVYSYYSNMFTSINFGQNNFGSFNWGGFVYKDKIVNNINWLNDLYVNITDWNKSFYIGGQTLGTFADIPEVRREEFRQIVLRIKPVNTAAFLLINYT